MQQTKWFSRTFDFTTTQNIFPSIIERLAGTPARLEEKLKSTPADILSVRIDGTWTIKENIGHLTDLEPLWQGRLEDILNGETELRPTDLQNTATSEANHDAVAIEVLLSNFRNARMKTIQLLNNLDEKAIFKSALHPRLKTPMRTMDLFLFVAEHDDHHLSRMTELAKIINHQ
ncbi:DinB family protein [Danxiaibacter flavus]|uniref:DinB family protein n=1 Tax=Danxiaibacter flavus TaxID=3049108 RepID=A0ABV3ZDS1_9BACT|nr:DinB family protein [Chitinophagaceae bacterium DXS]